MSDAASSLKKWSYRLLWLGLFALGLLALWETRPPSARGSETPLEQFSAARAISHLSHFAQEPHPLGSAAQERVRSYLIGTLRRLGAEARIEKTSRMKSADRFVSGGVLQNIVATVKGTASGKAVMVVAHYDSVPRGPGAADDGAGVSCILEMIRAIRAGPPLPYDLFVLLTTGEEEGLLGARGFVGAHPDLARQVGLIINLEARGSAGPTLMFETSDDNGALVRKFARAAPYPMASSLMVSIYRSMPNDTDLTVLKTTGAEALNFAFIERSQNYHTRFDSIKNLDARSVQQMGANLLGLVRHFGNESWHFARQPDCVYFNWLGRRSLFVYTVWSAWALALTTLVLCVLGSFGRRLSFKNALTGGGLFLVLFLSIAAGLLLSWGGISILLRSALCEGDTFGNHLLFAGLMAFGFACGCAVLATVRIRIDPLALGWGMTWMAAILAAVLLFVLPGGSYVLQWPAFFGAIALLFGQRAKRDGARAFWAFLGAAPAVLILVPLTYFFFVALGLSSALMVAEALLLTVFLAAAFSAEYLLRSGKPRLVFEKS